LRFAALLRVVLGLVALVLCCGGLFATHIDRALETRPCVGVRARSSWSSLRAGFFMVIEGSSLQYPPDLLEKIGRVIAEYTGLEVRMYIVYALISAHSGEECFQKFYELRSLNRRKELVVMEAETILDPLRLAALKRLWRRFFSAADRRTEVAHCTFLVGKNDVLRLRLIGTKPHFEPLTGDIFERTIRQYRTLGKDLLVFATTVAGSEDRLHRILQSLPLSQRLSTPVELLETPPDQRSLETDELKASLSRLKLLPLFPEFRE
jgi:hypothetical protein